MNFSRLLLVPVAVLLFTGCSERHLIRNKNYRTEVENAFLERKEIAKNRESQLFNVFEKDLSLRESEAIKFLFSYMPLNDLADYDGDFFLANVRRALLAKERSPWGRSVPDNIFLHYVLPVRVNNENLDSFRIKYYDELTDRLKGISDIGKAALEINHWCHEKVTYQPSDMRTSSPIYTILSARGRCGEESTLTVAALRTVGIPARQVYTPRWAHIDDNHAWVEVWINGTWHYLGACEPEPVLDRGWFTEPARRAMLIHSKSFGAWYGDENYITRHKLYTEINNLSNYAPTKRIYVKVTDQHGNPASDAIVEYNLYNYAEFYPLATVPADASGISSFETGLGDLLVWAHKGNYFDFDKISVSETDTIELRLHQGVENNTVFEYDMMAPFEPSPYENISGILVEENNRRLDEENKIRTAYVDTWIKAADSEDFAGEISCNPDSVREILTKSMGNYLAIMSFLRNINADQRITALKLLYIISEKDLRDVQEEVLRDHLENCTTPFQPGIGTNMWAEYILNPRIANEMLVSWRSFLQKALPEEIKSADHNNPEIIADYIESSIEICNEENYYKTPVTPKGVHEMRIADEKSRAIYFVALCRCLGIPARIEPASSVPQYYSKLQWHNVFFSDQIKPSDGKAFLRLYSTDKNPVPEYYSHFTLAQYKSGKYYTLGYDYNKKITDFDGELQLPPGHYMSVTGNRIDGNRVLTRIAFFELQDGEHVVHQVAVRKETSPARIYGKINYDDIIRILNNTEVTYDSFINKGAVIALMDFDKEPTKHFLNDLFRLKQEFDNWGGHIIFLSRPDMSISSPGADAVEKLPSKLILGIDNGKEFPIEAFDVSSYEDLSLPAVIFADKNGNILLRSSGYRIGTGEMILKKIQ